MANLTRLLCPKPTVANLRDLAMHMYIHAGYRDNGYDKMTREMRDLYLYVTGRDKVCDECGQTIPYADDEKVKS